MENKVSNILKYTYGNIWYRNNVQQCLTIEVFKAVRSIGPPFMKNILKQAPVKYNLRLRDRLRLPKTLSVNNGYQSISFRGSSIWNKLSNVYKEAKRKGLGLLE